MSAKEKLEALCDALLSDDEGISEESYTALLNMFDCLGLDCDADESVECVNGRYMYPVQED